MAHSAVPGALQRTRFDYDEATGEIASLVHVPAGYGKVTTLTRVQSKLGIPDGRVVYTGDGTSDIHVLLHVNQRDGFTVAVSEARDIAQIAKRTVISDDALSVLIPILEDLCGWDVAAIRAFFEAQNVVIHYFAKSQRNLLVLQIAAAFVWIAYGIILSALPVIVANSVVAAAATFTVLRARRADPGRTDGRFVKSGP